MSENVISRPPYQDYDWCFDKYITKNMTMKEIAKEYGYSLRVIRKWMTEKYNLSNRTYKYHKRLSPIQVKLVKAGILGDGHIDKRPEHPIYIESHAEDEKDYLFWKYELLKDLCNSAPSYKEKGVRVFNNKEYGVQGTYRLETKSIMHLAEIRSLKRIDIVKSLTYFEFCIHILDDGHRGDHWEICVASWSDEEVDAYINRCKELGLKCKRNCDIRYCSFDSVSSRLIDKIVLNNIPNNLDIINKKIICNTQIKKKANYVYVYEGKNKVGISTYCKFHNIKYDDLIHKVRKMKLKGVTPHMINILVRGDNS